MSGGEEREQENAAPPERELNDAGQTGPMGPSSWIEKQIREALERGEFDNLPGAGKPLGLADSADPDWWVKAKMAKENLETSDLVPPVIALRREAQSYPAALVEFAREEDVREVLLDYNQRVVADIRSPKFGPTIPVVAPRVDVDDMVGRWRVLRAEFERERAAALRAAADDTGETVSNQPQNEQPPVPLLIFLALVLTASGAAQVAVLLSPEPMLFPKPVAAVILAIAVLGVFSIIRIIRSANRSS
ncbi:MAG: DUF1992 domain-containing protein [Dermatophilus congolensis]|nr:DUF1992 domain-containing protein [Dermatophilus congolensis]